VELLLLAQVEMAKILLVKTAPMVLVVHLVAQGSLAPVVTVPMVLVLIQGVVVA